MKKQFVMAFAAIACGLAFTACSNEDNTGDAPYPHYKVLTFEDKDWGGSTNFVGQKSWSSLIDSPQYGGDLLYPADFDDEKDQLYYWYDQGNTGLYSELLNGYGDGAYWGGGIAISNYVDADLTHGTYLNQLSVPVSNGSSNFAVAFCNSNPTISYYNPQISIKFKNGREYLIKSMKVAPTIYQLNIAKNGNAGVHRPRHTSHGLLHQAHHQKTFRQEYALSYSEYCRASLRAVAYRQQNRHEQ